VNSKFGGFEIQTSPIPPVFPEFQKIQPVFLTLRPSACASIFPIHHIQALPALLPADEMTITLHPLYLTRSFSS
jgi:hypothetical protein